MDTKTETNVQENTIINNTYMQEIDAFTTANISNDTANISNDTATDENVANEITTNEITTNEISSKIIASNATALNIASSNTTITNIIAPNEIDYLETPYGGILGIDVGQEHMAMCLKLHNERQYRFFLFSFVDPLKKNVPYCTKLKQLHLQLENVYQKFSEITQERYKRPPTDVIKNIYIEQQVAEINIKFQYAIMMWFVIKGFKIFPQQAAVKYRLLERKMQDEQEQQAVKQSALTFRQSTSNKILGQYFVMTKFIDAGLVNITYQQEFGKNSSKHNKNGSVKMCRWYSANTKRFVQENDIDKLDDIADSLLIVLASLKYAPQKDGYQQDVQYDNPIKKDNTTKKDAPKKRNTQTKNTPRKKNVQKDVQKDVVQKDDQKK